jgi:hypothetical protein
VGSVACHLEHPQEVRVEGTAQLLQVHVEEAPVVRPAGCHHQVVYRCRQFSEESLQGSRIVGVEGRYAQRVKLAGGALQALGIPAGEDKPGPLRACSPGRFEPDAGATANHDDSLPKKFRFSLDGSGSAYHAHNSSHQR